MKFCSSNFTEIQPTKFKSSLVYWLVVELYGVESAWNLGNRSIAKVSREELKVDGGRHEDQFEIWSLMEDALHHTQQEVRVDMSFVNLSLSSNNYYHAYQ